MFQGVVHANSRKVIAGYVEHLPQNVHVIGSGNFSIETTLRANGFQGVITGCDVSLYSCALGAYLAGIDLPISLNAAEFPELTGLEPFLEDAEGRAAAVSVALDALRFRKQDNAYKRRMYRAYLRQIDVLCEQTREKLQTKRVLVRLDEFHVVDGWQRIVEIPDGPDHAILTFPPTYARGYERLYADLNNAFRWGQPEYRELTSGVEFAESVIERPGPWLIGAETPTPELEQVVGSPIFLTSRGTAGNLSLYSNIAAIEAQLIRRRVNVRKPNWARLTENDEITEASQLAVHPISRPKANYIRQVYGSVDITQADAPFCYAVTVDGKLFGLLMFAPDVRPRPAESDVDIRDGVYLMCDLAVSHDRDTNAIKFGKNEDVNSLGELAKRVLTAFMQHDSVAA